MPLFKRRVARGAFAAALALFWSGAGGALTACGAFAQSEEPPDGGALPDLDATVGADAFVADSPLVDATVESATDSGDSGAQGGPCDGAEACPRYIFVTSDTFTGEDIGGSIAADGKCTVLASLPAASSVLRGRKFRAWMSDDIDQTQAALRLTHGTRPYRLADGTLIANSWAQLTSGADLLHPIDRDEKNNSSLSPTFVWTGTTAFGLRTQSTCSSWTIGDPANVGTVGSSTTSISAWTNAGTMTCQTGLRLYCFEQ